MTAKEDDGGSGDEVAPGSGWVFVLPSGERFEVGENDTFDDILERMMVSSMGGEEE